MAAKPKKSELADDVVQRLKGVLRGQGYYTDLGRQAGKFVGRRIRVLSQMQSADFPAAAVLMGRAERSDQENAGEYRDDVQVGVLMWARADDVTAELERLEADAKKVLCGGTTLLAQAYGRARWIETTPYYNEVEMVDRGCVLVSFLVRVNWTPADP